MFERFARRENVAIQMSNIHDFEVVLAWPVLSKKNR